MPYKEKNNVDTALCNVSGLYVLPCIIIITNKRGQVFCLRILMSVLTEIVSLDKENVLQNIQNESATNVRCTIFHNGQQPQYQQMIFALKIYKSLHVSNYNFFLSILIHSSMVGKKKRKIVLSPLLLADYLSSENLQETSNGRFLSV